MQLKIKFDHQVSFLDHHLSCWHILSKINGSVYVSIQKNFIYMMLCKCTIFSMNNIFNL